MSDVPPPKEYLGPSGVIRNSIWLTSEDIPNDKDTPVTIEKVNMRRQVKFAGGRARDVAVSLKFVGKDRELLVNATAKKVLNALANSNLCGAWKGMNILLYVDPNIRRADGTSGPAIRLRARKAPQGPPPAVQAEAPSSTDGDAEYREIMGAGGGA